MKLKLDGSQQKALSDIENCLLVRAGQIRDLLEPSASPERREKWGGLVHIQAGDDEIASSFGILGPRGAGKSTILRALYETREKNRENGLHFLPPLDCSLVGNDVSPGAAILLHLEGELSKRTGSVKLNRELCERLRSLAGLYVAGSNDFRALGAEWSSSAGDHVEFVLSGIVNRLRLRDQVGDWLRDATKTLETTAFVILLDDFDLVHAEEVRRWMLALLDELRQPRFLIVLTADFYRLEHLSLDPEAEFDDKTGRALLGKMLPAQNRVNLDRWDYEARENFGAKINNGRDPHQGEESTESGGLGESIAAFGWSRKAQTSLLKRLLPGWPRGLVNLYARLTERTPIRGKSEKDRLSTFLGILASCRAEPLLARELREAPLAAWLRSLRFSADISVEDWQEAVEIAEERERERKGIDFRPIQLLRPVLPLGHQAGGFDGLWGQEVIAELAAQAGLDRSDVSGQDSLRHDFLRVKPLRDAQPPILCYWAELLLNFGMMVPPPSAAEGGSVSARHEAIRNRVYLLDHWGPVQERLSRAVFKINGLQPGEFREWFLENDNLPLSTLLWLSWSGKERIDLRIGWPPLLSALRRARRPLEREKMAELLLNAGEFEGASMSGGSAEDLEIVPDEIWAIILLVDALDRCPWSALGGSAEWRVQTYLLLAVALVRSSYVYALVRSTELSWEELSPDQTWFVDALGRRDPWGFFNVIEEDLVKRIRKLMADRLDERISEQSSLSCAARAFFSSPAYTDLRALALRPEGSG